jgi:type I restriction enzyme R subunit
MGFTYLDPAQAHMLRGERNDHVLLRPVLQEWLKANNDISYKGVHHSFSDHNIDQAIERLKQIPLNEGLLTANEHVFNLLTLGKSLEQNVEGDKKSFSLQYINWQEPEKNVYHCTAEYAVLREGRNDTYRPDIICFVNGIPLVVIENKRPDLQTEGKPVDAAISQHLRNQNKDDGILKLFKYSQLLLALSGNDAKYGTTNTPAKFWSVCKEQGSKRDLENLEQGLLKLKNQKDKAFWDQVFTGDWAYARRQFEELYTQQVSLTEQDRLIYALLRPERLLDLIYKFTLYDAGVKKVTRYQQYFAIQNTLSKVAPIAGGKRQGGVIWHTQGSGKSLTMVMLAKALSLEKSIKNPRVIVVTDRIDLDEQISKTFKNCGKDTHKATSGRHLLSLLRQGKAEVITTVLGKFEKPQTGGYKEESANVFVLIDESHRSQYGSANVKMQQVLPNACFVAFTGTPLMKKDKTTISRFGGYIDKYTIDQAVEDGAVVPLLYEGREIGLEINQKVIDNYFEIISKNLSDDQRMALKKKFSRADQLNQAEQRLWMIAHDVSDHFEQTWQGTGFKGQLTAPSKASAVKLKGFFDEIGAVTTEVIISGIDTREGHEEVNKQSNEVVVKFWKQMMDTYGNEKRYQESIIDQFKKHDHPEILIVVDKLLTGFDAPNNTVLYLARSLREHNLLQAIARVNRLAEGKRFGYIIDYYGLLGELDTALTSYSSLDGFEEDDLKGTVSSVNDELKKIAQAHANLWDVFKSVPNKKDKEALEKHLDNKDLRDDFYELHTEFARLLKLGLSTLKWVEQTPEEKISTNKKDLKFFTDLRKSIKLRYSDDIDYGVYEKQIQSLIDKHVSAEKATIRVELVNISNKEEFDAEVERVEGVRAKADTIASRTSKYITENLDKDPAFYKRLSQMLREVVDEMHAKWDSISEEAQKVYLDKVKGIMEQARTRKTADVPDDVASTELSLAIYHMLIDQISGSNDQLAADQPNEEILPDLTMKLYGAILVNKKVDWHKRYDVINEMKRALDGVLFDSQKDYRLQLSTNAMDEIIEKCIELAKHHVS